MKIAVVGAGAIGGYVGGWLARPAKMSRSSRAARTSAPFVERNARDRWKDGTEVIARAACVRQTSDAGPQDVVVLAVKAHQVGAIGGRPRGVLPRETAIVTMQNGIPGGISTRTAAPTKERRCGPRTRTARSPVSSSRAHRRLRGLSGGEADAPGVVQVVEGNRFTLGELDGSVTARVSAYRRLRRAGFKAPVITNIRSEIWLKLWGNPHLQPDQRADARDAGGHLPVPADARAGRADDARGANVANKLGITFRVGIDKRIAGAEKVGKHKTSMLQDVEAGRAPEIDALVGSVVELGRLTQHADAAHRRRLCAGQAAGQDHGRGKGPRADEPGGLRPRASRCRHATADLTAGTWPPAWPSPQRAARRSRVFDGTVHLRPARPGPYTAESGRADYEAAHVPGAAFVDLLAELSHPHPTLRFTLPAPEVLAARARYRRSVRRRRVRAVYSSTSPMWATRLWWMLHALGVPSSVLDGGLPKWQAEGRPVARGVERYPPRPAASSLRRLALGRPGRGAARHCRRRRLPAQRADGLAARRPRRCRLRPQGPHPRQRQPALPGPVAGRRLLPAAGRTARGLRRGGGTGSSRAPSATAAAASPPR